MIQSMINDAERKQGEKSDDPVRLWLQDLQRLAYDVEDVLDECDYEHLRCCVETRGEKKRKRSSITSDIVDKIKDINVRFDELKERTRLFNLVSGEFHPTTMQLPKTDSLLGDSKVSGREDDVLRILDMLDDLREKGYLISGVSIVGMGGLGKTTVAKLIYKKAQEEKRYDLVAWVCVSEDFNEETILRELYEHFKACPHPSSINMLVEDLAKELEKKIFLLVLDDVWNKDYSKWNAFSDRLSRLLKTTRNSIVVTTRDEQVAFGMMKMNLMQNSMQIYKMRKLSSHECWSIIEEKVLRLSGKQSISLDLKDIGVEIAKKCGGLPLIAIVIGGALNREIQINVKMDAHGDIKSCKMHDVVHDLALAVAKDETLILKAGCKIDENATILHLRVKHDGSGEKTRLHNLKLGWNRWEGDQSNHEEVLEGFQPHSNLKGLFIDYYNGKSFPKWMMRGVNNSGATFLSNNLVELNLESWDNCEHIPSLGLLPSLKYLRIYHFKNVKRMGHKFDTTRSNSPGGVEPIKLFPALRQLTLGYMKTLEEWVEVDDDDIAVGSKVEIVFPSLEILEIYSCPQLEIWRIGGFSSHHKLSSLEISGCDNLIAIPDMDELSSLETLGILNCGALTYLPSGLGSSISLQDLCISHCINLRSVPKGCLRYITRLKKLEMGPFCEELELFPGLSYIHQLNSSLEDLALYGWDKVKSLPDQLQHLIALKKLTLDGFKGVEAFPEGLGNLASLQQLFISDCGNLKHLFPLQALRFLHSLSIGPFFSELEEIPTLSCTHHLHASLKYLGLQGWDKVEFLPDQLQHFTGLQKLCLENFNRVEVLPDWLGNLSSLRQLHITNCGNLMSMPSIEAMQRLTNLRYLEIVECPKLKERCTKYSRAEWSKISHILQINIDGQEPWTVD
ncbi:hypothetical protein SLEP1_g57370 [Rubroshorea leprosula]|uniref:Uncharacterized protein n=1 Tax=Rubroshorea leprosula TaxID=152421 RepID=A0AAV5MMF9_9ROSI|nr:hypothetical protein SLEP1_g57370 [Rubroshorea leprosula]